MIPFDRGTLASHIGTTRENLSRNLALLTEHGVRVRGREIVIDARSCLRPSHVRNDLLMIRCLEISYQSLQQPPAWLLIPGSLPIRRNRRACSATSASMNS